MTPLRHVFYKIQHKIAITRQESMFLLVCLVLTCTGLIAQYVYEPHHPAPDAHAQAEQRFQERVQQLADARARRELEEPSAGAADEIPTRADEGTESVQIQLNAASQAELQELPGIGPALAERIARYRDAVGYFRREDELLDVSGIGPRTLENLTPHIQLGPPTGDTSNIEP